MQTELIKQKITELWNILQIPENECGKEDDCSKCIFRVIDKKGGLTCGLGNIMNEITETKFYKEEL